jgi:Ca2+-binding RTX toxin-like protein
MHHHLRPIQLLNTLAPLLLLCALTLPATATAASETWNPATGALVVTTDASDTGIGILAGWDKQPGLTACGTNASPTICPKHTGVTSLTIIAAQPNLKIGLDDDALLNGTSATPTPLTINGASRAQFTYRCSPPKTTQHRCTIQALGSGLDTNHDSQPDVVFTNTTLSVLKITTGDGNDLVDLRRLTVPLTGYLGYETDTDMNAGNDRYYGTNKRDILGLGSGHDTANLYAGNDSASGGLGTNTINAGAGNDTLNGTKNSTDTFYGGPGNDEMLLHDGNDRAWGGSGNDVVDHSTGALWVNLGTGNDQVRHYQGPFTGYGGPGNDYFAINYKGSTGRNARIDCGTGHDDLYAAYPHRKNCENIYFPNTPIGQ